MLKGFARKAELIIDRIFLWIDKWIVLMVVVLMLWIGIIKLILWLGCAK